MKKVVELVTKIGKIPVLALPHIQQAIANKVIDSKKFKDYIKKIDNVEKGVQVSQIELLSIQMFGEKVGFVNMRAVTKKDGYSLPSYVFLRGPAVAVLLIVNGKLLLVQQYRVPIQQSIIQAPAGMLDESGDFMGVAAKEIQEQTGIKLTHDKLIDLGTYIPSGGGSDEEIIMFYCQIKISQQELKVIQEKIHGQGQHERIKVVLQQFTPQNVLATRDSKLIALSYAYTYKKKANL